MKALITLILLLVVTGCISRTVRAPALGSGYKEVVVERKLVWIWDKDF
jgi:hypothetical protein